MSSRKIDDFINSDSTNYKIYDNNVNWRTPNNYTETTAINDKTMGIKKSQTVAFNPNGDTMEIKMEEPKIQKGIWAQLENPAKSLWPEKGFADEEKGNWTDNILYVDKDADDLVKVALKAGMIVGTGNDFVMEDNARNIQILSYDEAEMFYNQSQIANMMQNDMKNEAFDKTVNAHFEKNVKIDSYPEFEKPQKEMPINKDEEIIVNIEELANELAEQAMKSEENKLKYEELLEIYKKMIIKHERRQKEQ